MNFLILLYLVAISPKLLFDRLLKGKRHPGFLQRIGFNIPTLKGPTLWIHAVSVGEIKAAQPLFRELRKKHPEAQFLITTTSATGQAEAKRSLPEADAFAYLPIDLSWVVNAWVKKIQPVQFILIESDFWYNLLKALKKNRTFIALVSGKLSERSAKRFQTFSRFSKKLFGLFDLLCVQNEDHYRRFLPLVPDPSLLHVTGNLKLDIQPQPVSAPLHIPQPAITISCTHFPEEALLLDALKDGPWFIILAPRHPERFEEVAQLLSQKKIPFTRWSQPQPYQKVLLVDTMGQLPACYSSSRLAIVAGSYVDHIGGHNLLEPCLYGAPVLFGPHIFGQTEFASRALESGAGLCVPLPQLRETVETLLNRSDQKMREAAQRLITKSRGATSRTITLLFGERSTRR